MFPHGLQSGARVRGKRGNNIKFKIDPFVHGLKLVGKTRKTGKTRKRKNGAGDFHDLVDRNQPMIIHVHDQRCNQHLLFSHTRIPPRLFQSLPLHPFIIESSLNFMLNLFQGSCILVHIFSALR